MFRIFRFRAWFQSLPKAEMRCLGFGLENIIDMVRRGYTPNGFEDNYWKVTIERKKGEITK